MSVGGTFRSREPCQVNPKSDISWWTCVAFDKSVRAVGVGVDRKHRSRPGKIWYAFAAAECSSTGEQEISGQSNSSLGIPRSKARSDTSVSRSMTRSKSRRRSISERLTLYLRYRKWSAALPASPIEQNATAAIGTDRRTWPLLFPLIAHLNSHEPEKAPDPGKRTVAAAAAVDQSTSPSTTRREYPHQSYRAGVQRRQHPVFGLAHRDQPGWSMPSFVADNHQPAAIPLEKRTDRHA